ncbi:MAG: sulfatase [Candidatus Promineifilaceae bacterium]|nr:sulfatase [Candidatus Promineifilaceae bacterium]
MIQPDILFLVLDTQRADRLGCYGNERGLTPNIDRFARSGVLYEQAVAPAQWTIPSHASMFTGRYATAHGVVQSSQSLTPDSPHLAEIMRSAGYETVAFCNNPLVGVLNNGFKRGFHTFYNYGGAIPSVPERSSPFPWPLSRLASSYTQLLRRISYPIQNFFGRSDLAFSIFLNAWLTPLWSRFANFKGQNERSVRDVVDFLQQREKRPRRKPLFLFVNLMETHLPFWPPAQFVDQVAPYFRRSREARTLMRKWNREAYRWAIPLAEPLEELEARVLQDMYDAEVAYQDDYLGALFETLKGRGSAVNTLSVIVADHGDGLGEHGYMGHAFVAYQELLHVPLILHWPRRLPAGHRVAQPVSTRRVFHTMIDAVGELPEGLRLNRADVNRLSLVDPVYGRDAEQGQAFAEIYPPTNFVKAIEHRQPELLDQFRCLSLRRTLIEGALKLVTVDGERDELFDLSLDPRELENILAERPEVAARLDEQLQRIVQLAERYHEELEAGATVELEDERLLQQLRGLGYIE